MELLTQVRFIDSSQGIDRPSDLLIDRGKIIAIAEQISDLPSNTQIITGEGLILGRGLIDLYSHSGEPGNESRETLQNLADAARAGGFSQVGILPDTLPRIDNLQILTTLKQQTTSTNDHSPKIHFWGAASATGNTRQMNELTELKSGIIGFYDRFNLGNLNLFKQLLTYLQPWQSPLAIALDRNELVGGGVIREGAASIRYGMVSNPSCSESAIIAAVLEIVAEIPTPIHIMRVSTQRGVELIAAAKQRHLPVTASTTWMHLLWNSEAVASYNPNLRLEPPLGNPKDQEALIVGLKQGIIDAIAIDHQAYTYEEKTVPFASAPPGAIGLEMALPLLWQELVVTQKLSALELWQAMSINPLRCLSSSAISMTANLILFDPQKTWTADRHNLKSPAVNSPYYGREIVGKVIRSIISEC